MDNTGLNMGRVREKNRSLILKYINDKGPSSRKDISRETGLTAASVTQISAALIEEGILKVSGVLDREIKMPGRKKVLLDIDADSSLTFAVNAEPDMTCVAICNLKGSILKGTDGNALINKFPTESDKDPLLFLDKIAASCRELEDKLPAGLSERIENVSFCITGIMDRDDGVSLHAYGIWEEKVDIRGAFKERLGKDVLIENNVDAFALAELLYGTGRNHEDILVIKWGPGVGSSVIIDNSVYRGHHGKTAELGHFIVDPEGKKCVCGRRGCLETKLSAKALKALKGKEQRSEAIDIFARSIVNTGTILAPERIVLFGSLSEDKNLREGLIEACSRYDSRFNENRIVHTSLAGKENYIGPAAVFAWNKFSAGR